MRAGRRRGAAARAATPRGSDTMQRRAAARRAADSVSWRVAGLAAAVIAAAPAACVGEEVNSTQAAAEWSRRFAWLLSDEDAPAVPLFPAGAGGGPSEWHRRLQSEPRPPPDNSSSSPSLATSVQYR